MILAVIWWYSRSSPFDTNSCMGHSIMMKSIIHLPNLAVHTTMLFSLQAIKTVDFTNAPVTSFHCNKLLFFVSGRFFSQQKALYQKWCLSEVYGPLFIREGWVPSRIRIFIKTEFSAWSVNKQRWTKDTRDNVNQYGAGFLSWILPLFFTIILLGNGQLLLSIKSFRIRRVPDLLVSSLAVIVIYLPAFLDSGLARGNVHARDS